MRITCVNQRAACAGHTEANKQVKVAEDHDSSSGTKDSRSHEQKVLQESSEEEGHTGHVSPEALRIHGPRFWCLPQRSFKRLVCHVSGVVSSSACLLQAIWGLDAGALYTWSKRHGCSAYKSWRVVQVLDDGTETNRGAVVGASASAIDGAPPYCLSAHLLPL